MSIFRRVWNAFTERDPPKIEAAPAFSDYSVHVSSFKPDRVILSRGQEKTIMASIINRIAIDASALRFVHCRVDEEDRYLGPIDSKFNRCLRVEANIDESARAFRHNAVLSLLDTGDIAIVPTDTTADPNTTEGYDILSMRIGRVVQWWPDRVRVDLYNERKGVHDQIVLSKKYVAIVENPLRSIMNDPSSTAKRLNEKLSLLDYIDRDNSSGKLNLLFQLPYDARTDKRKKYVENRRTSIRKQLVDDPYGIAYIDSSERVIQLNRSVENGLFEQVEYYTKMLMSQLGITEEILNGKASEQELMNYFNMTVEPIVTAIVDEMRRKFLSSNAITRGESIKVFRDPFKMATLTTIANAADSFIRNEILSANDIRTDGLGYKPSDDPKADQLANPNINPQSALSDSSGITDYDSELAKLDEYDSQLDELEKELSHSDDILEHSEYDSKYYDPVKAHEYYERTKAARGLYKGIYKKGTTLNEKGQAAKAYISKRIKEETAAKIKGNTESADKRISKKYAATQQELARHKNIMESKISALQEYLKNVPASVKKVRSQNIQKQIKLLRSRNAQERARILGVYNADKSKITDERQKANSKIRENAKNTQTIEIEKLKEQKEFTKQPKAKKKKKKQKKKKEKKKKDDTSEYEKIIKEFWKRENAKK